MKHKLPHLTLRKTAPLLVTALVSTVGILLLNPSKAATSLIAMESEDGSLAGAASLVTDAQASGGAAVRFSTTTPVEGAIIVSPSGNDTSGNGTLTAPYKTFARALSAAVAGTTIYARAGTYDKFEVAKSGSADKPITIASYPGEKAVVVGGTAGFYNQGIIMLMSVSYVTVQDMEFRDIGGDGTGFVVQNSSHVIIKNNIVHDVQHAGIDVSGSDITIDGNEVYNACELNSPGAPAGTIWPPALTTKRLTTGATSTNIDIINNYVHDSWGEGIDAWFLDGGTVDNNRAINNYSVNLYVDDSRNLTITNNFMQSTNDTHNAGGKGRPSALAVASETGSIRPTNLIINSNTDGGGHSEGIVWHNNGVFDITQSPSPQDMPNH